MNIALVSLQLGTRSYGDYPRDLAIDGGGASPVRLFRRSVLPELARGIISSGEYPYLDIALPPNRTTTLTLPATASGEAFEYRFRVPDAGTFWYHARRDSGALAQGLYGALIVEESLPVETDRDVLLILDEWRFEDDGTIAADRPRSPDLAR